MPSDFAFISGRAERFQMSEREASCYLAGLIDGEGCVYVPKTGKSTKRCIQITNTEWDLIEAIVECCDTLGVPFSVTKQARKPPCNDAWVIMIAGKPNLEKIRDLVPMRSARKRWKLWLAIGRYAKKPRGRSGWRRTTDEEIRRRLTRWSIEAREAETRREVAKLDALLAVEA